MKGSPFSTVSARVALVGLLLAAGTLPAMAELFDAIDQTIRERSAGPVHASQLLGVTLEKSRTKSNDYFDVLTAGPSPSFPELKSAEIRVERRSGKIKMLLLDLDAAARCVPSNEVMHRFGTSPELSPPTARQPAGSAIFYVYHHPWGDLRVGLSPVGRQCVEMIVTEFND
jgi:hypothetical protein